MLKKDLFEDLPEKLLVSCEAKHLKIVTKAENTHDITASDTVLTKHFKQSSKVEKKKIKSSKSCSAAAECWSW